MTFGPRMRAARRRYILRALRGRREPGPGGNGRGCAATFLGEGVLTCCLGDKRFARGCVTCEGLTAYNLV